MVYIKNYLLIGTIIGAIKKALKAVYAVIAFLNLNLTLAVLLVGVILYFTGVFDKLPEIFYLFIAIVVLSVIYALSANLNAIKKLFTGKGKKEKKSPSNPVSANTETEPQPDTAVVKENPPTTKSIAENRVKEKVKPSKVKYYRVKQNPRYIMAEYSDKYVLYYDNGNGYTYIRTDYK